jgi:hypothetical protein
MAFSSSRARSSVIDRVHSAACTCRIDPGDLGSRHTVLDPNADARELRLRDLRRYPFLGGDRRFAFVVIGRRWRQRLQDTPFTCRLVD